MAMESVSGEPAFIRHDVRAMTINIILADPVRHAIAPERRARGRSRGEAVQRLEVGVADIARSNRAARALVRIRQDRVWRWSPIPASRVPSTVTCRAP